MRRIKDEFNYFTLELDALLKKYGYRMDVEDDLSIVIDWFNEKEAQYKGIQAPDRINNGAFGFRPYEQIGKDKR